MEYKNEGSAEENEILIFGIYCGNNTFSLQSGSERRYHGGICFLSYILLTIFDIALAEMTPENYQLLGS